MLEKLEVVANQVNRGIRATEAQAHSYELQQRKKVTRQSPQQLHVALSAIVRSQFLNLQSLVAPHREFVAWRSSLYWCRSIFQETNVVCCVFVFVVVVVQRQ